MRIERISRRYFEQILKLEQRLFGPDEGLNRPALFLHLYAFGDCCWMAVEEVVLGYVLSCVRHDRTAWVTALACVPERRESGQTALKLAYTLAEQLHDLGVERAMATTQRPSIVRLGRHFNQRILGYDPNYFGLGRGRYKLEFRSPGIRPTRARP